MNNTTASGAKAHMKGASNVIARNRERTPDGAGDVKTLTVRQYLRWHLPNAWWAKSGRLMTRFPCKICGLPKQWGREMLDTHGWSNLCERDFRRVRIVMGMRGARPMEDAS